MSENEEMYLITIARVHESEGLDYVPLSMLANHLEVLPVSVNQMIHKLEGEGFVSYAPYKGVFLTSQGRETANRILRKRRLWEVFLVKHLQFSVEEADMLACRLEHFFPYEAAEHLANFLGDPLVSPAGEIIPGSSSEYIIDRDLPLSQLQVEQKGVVTRFGDYACGNMGVLDFLNSEGIQPGVEVEVIAAGSGGSQLLHVVSGGDISISKKLADDILVRRIRENK